MKAIHNFILLSALLFVGCNSTIDNEKVEETEIIGPNSAPLFNCDAYEGEATEQIQHDYVVMKFLESYDGVEIWQLLISPHRYGLVIRSASLVTLIVVLAHRENQKVQTELLPSYWSIVKQNITLGMLVPYAFYERELRNNYHN